jgi:hypothetical protein
MSREAYLGRYDGQVAVLVPPAGGDVHFLSSGGRIGLWSPASYLDANPDVRGYWPSPLHHYLMHGFREGRTMDRGSAGSGRPGSPPAGERLSFLPLGAAVVHQPAVS